MLEVCKQLFTQWNESDIAYCHWKSNEHLEEGLNGGTDLDVYVIQEHKTKAEKLLKSCNYVECDIQKGHRYPNVVEWMGFDAKTGRLVHVHLHYQIITGTKYCKEYVFPLDDVIIETRIKDSKTGVYVTNPDLEIIILYCRIALKARNHYRISPNTDDTREISYLKKLSNNCNVSRLCEQLIGDNGRYLYELIECESLDYNSWKDVYDIAEKWLRPYRKYGKVNVFFRYRYYKYREYVIITHNKFFNNRWINKKTFPNTDLSICFLGQDGSGKSTVTIELCKWFNWKVEANRFYLGSGDHYNGFFKRFISFCSKVTHRNDKKQQDNKSEIKTSITIIKKKTIKNLLSSLVVCCYYLSLARRAYKVMNSAEIYKNKNGIALFDRFPQMQFDGISDGPRIAKYYNDNGLDFSINRWLARIEQSIFKRIQKMQPQLVFKLMLPPEESIRRKPSEDLKNVTEKHYVTKELIFPNSIVYEIDATQNYEQELISIKNKVWEYIVQHQE